MINRSRSFLFALSTLALLSAPATVLAQESTTDAPKPEAQAAQPEATTEPAEAAAGEEAPASEQEPQEEEDSKDDDAIAPEGDATDAQATQPETTVDEDEEDEDVVEPTTPPSDVQDDTSSNVPDAGFEPVPSTDSPISDLAGMSDEDFVPLEDIEEEDIDPIFPAKVYPYIDWSGQFRFRHRVASKFDLGTQGTSAILPPTESYTPTGNPANPDATRLWGSDIRLRLEPTLSITEGVKVHIEADLLGNQVLGSLPVNGLPPNPIRPDPSRNQVSSNQFSARESEWFQNAFTVNEAYGELNGFFGTLRAGRMDNHWGLGMFYNDGDCMDCDWGDSIDRVMVQSQFKGIYGRLTADWPGEGITSSNSNSPLGQPYDRTQIDDINQYTLSLSRAPQTQLEIERQHNTLTTQHKPVLNGGAMFTWRTQEGTFSNPFEDPDLSVTGNPLIYRGMNMYIGDAWAQFLYNPKADTMIRVELEFMGVIGSMDNSTMTAVGRTDNEDANADINCFNEDARAANDDTCNQFSKAFQQYGLALETEFSVGGPVDFGVNAGFASGGTTPNWGMASDSQLNGDDLDFFRFDPDYHIDLILFRNVIGTVTNATYVNPYMQATFLDRGERKLRFDLDGILSRAWDMEGTPSGVSPWLGVELDGAMRFFLKDAFHASLEGGLLLPFEGLSARTNRPRLTQFGTTSPEFTDDADATTAWTVQFKANWKF